MSSESEVMMRKSKRTLAPKLRFPEFRNDDGWETKSLGSQGEFLASLSGKSAKDFDNGPATFVTYMNVFSNTFTNVMDRRAVDVAKDESQNAVAKGDVFFTVSSETPEDAGMSSVLLEDIENCYLNSFCALFRFDKGKALDSIFLGYFLRSAPARRHLSRGAQGATRYNISKSTFRDLPILLPTPSEQRKIADCLSSLDGLIVAEGRKLAALRGHKRGLMQQLFPQPGQTQPRLRFPEFRDTGGWKNEQLGTICKFVRGPFGGALKKEIFVSDGFAVYEQSHAIHGRLDTFRYFISEDKYRELKRFAVKANDIIMSCSGTMGRFTLIPQEPIPGVINQALLKLTVGKSFNTSFILRALELPSNLSKLLSQSAGGAIKNVVGVKDLKAVEISTPEPAEQQKIADCLTALDSQITVQAAKIEALKQHKSGLMQQLFPAPEDCQ